MIYNKPRDINLRVFPSLSSLVPQISKKSTSAFEEALSDSKSQKNVIEATKEDATKTAPSALPLENPDIILTEKPGTLPPSIVDVEEDTVFDVSEMQVIDGIPMLQLNDDTDNSTIKQSPFEEVPVTASGELLYDVEIDISEMPDIIGIPLLSLPDEPECDSESAPVVISTSLEELTDEQADLEQEKAQAVLKEAKSDILYYDEATEKANKKELRKTEKENKRAEKLLVKEERKKIKKINRDSLIEKIGKNRARLLKIASFFIMLYVGTILAFIIPLRPSYSETEKRLLAEFPEFTTQSFISGDYFADVSTWFSDTFPFREQLTKANTKIKNLYGFDTISIYGDVEQGDEIPDTPLEQPPVEESEPISKPEPQKPVTMPDHDELKNNNGDPDAERPDYNTQSLGAIIVANDSAYEYYSFSETLAPRFINAVSNINEASHNKSNVYAMLIPTSIDIKLNDALRADISSANQKKALEYFNASFKNTIAVDGIYDAERLHRDEYTYFRTDHHWTALGAYYAYEQFALEKGIDPVPLSKYNTKKFDGFLGTFYSGSRQTEKLSETPDEVIAYLPFNDATCHIVEADGDEFDWDVIKDVTNYGRGMKYLTFIGGDNAITTITNRDNQNGETCIVIKESFGNAFVPFLIPHYSTIYVIDPRHYSGTLSDFTKDKEINDIILLANISTTRNNIFIENMEEFIQ